MAAFSEVPAPHVDEGEERADDDAAAVRENGAAGDDVEPTCAQVAHNLTNVLSAILGYARLTARELPADAPLRTDMDVIAAAAARGIAMVDQLCRACPSRADVGP